MDTENYNNRVKASEVYITHAIGISLTKSYTKLMEINFAIEEGTSLKDLGVDETLHRKLINDVDQMLMLLKMAGKEVDSIYIPCSLKQIIPCTKSIDNQEF